jgi:hypothetical protein
MPAYQAIVRNGLMSAPDDIYNFAVGLKTFAGGITTVSRVHYTNLNEWFNTATNTDGSDNMDTRTQLLVCETGLPPPQEACALWTRYNLDNEPVTLGFSAGIADDGSTAYIGRGVLGGRIIPGRVKIGTGVYVTWAGDKLVEDPEYLVVQPGCSCSFMKVSLASNHPGMLLTPDQVYFYAHGRVTFTNGKISLTRVATAPFAYNFQEWYTNANGGESINQLANNVLVCETATPPNTPPVINFAEESCGVWSSVNYTNYVTALGFNAGSPSTNNTIAWVGRGSYASEFEVGRYQSDTGLSYLAYGNEQTAFASEYLIVPAGCTCKFILI